MLVYGFWGEGKLVRSLNSPFFPPHIGAQPGRAKEESRITCMRMLRTTPFFPPKSGEKPYLEVLSRFGLWRDFLSDNIQATISAFGLIKNILINSESVKFHQYHGNPHSICFFITMSIQLSANLCQDLLTIENTDSDLKVHALHYANELLVRVRLPFQKLLQHCSTNRKNTKKMFGKRVTYSLSIRVQSTINHISIFTFLCLLRQYQRQRKCFLSKRELKKALRDTLTRAAWLRPSNFWLARSEHAHASYPELFFRPLGLSPYMGREERRVQGLD